MNDKKELKSAIKRWLLEFDNELVIDNNIIALNFDISEPYQISLIGTSEYDKEDDDWACDDELDIDNYLNLDKLLTQKLNWEELLNLIVIILKELINELDIKLFSIKHITTGFVDGDLKIVK